MKYTKGRSRSRRGNEEEVREQRRRIKRKDITCRKSRKRAISESKSKIIKESNAGVAKEEEEEKE